VDRRLIGRKFLGMSRNGSRFSLYDTGTDRAENVSSIIGCSLVAGEMFPQSCSLATAAILSLFYKNITWQ
jgi:hypothetical protein